MLAWLLAVLLWRGGLQLGWPPALAWAAGVAAGCGLALASRLTAQLMPAPQMAALLAAAGAPASAAAIGIAPDRLRHTILAARFLRSRYTVLDLLDDTGMLAAAAAQAAQEETAR